MTRLEIATAILAAHLGDPQHSWQRNNSMRENIGAAFDLAEDILAEEKRRHAPEIDARYEAAVADIRAKEKESL